MAGRAMATSSALRIFVPSTAFAAVIWWLNRAQTLGVKAIGSKDRPQHGGLVLIAAGEPRDESLIRQDPLLGDVVAIHEHP